MYIPHDIYALVCEFAYNVSPKCALLSDIDFVISVQKNIPKLFFNTIIPTKDLFSQRVQLSLLGFFGHPNPFIRGNPYLPTDLLLKDSVVNIDLVHYAIELVETKAFHKYGTRKYFIHRTASSLHEYIFTGSWRYLKYTKLFFVLSEFENYNPKDLFETVLSKTIALQLSSRLPFT